MSSLVFSTLSTTLLGVTARAMYCIGHRYGRLDGRKEMRHEAIRTVDRLYTCHRDRFETAPDYLRPPQTQHRGQLQGMAEAYQGLTALRSQNQ